MKNGFSLFESRGETPSEILKSVDDTECFPPEYFHVIFSEQVLEHVADLSQVVKDQARLTISGGVGIHCFPGAKMIWEEHLNMPLVHWLPKSILRRYWIALMLLLRLGPKTPWPETKGKPFWDKVNVYLRYVNDNTFYRDNKAICSKFSQCGFEARYEVVSRNPLPVLSRRNGFPSGNIHFFLARR